MSDLENKKNPVVITIARDFGAEGHEIGRMLADELGIPLYDNELLVRRSCPNGPRSKRPHGNVSSSPCYRSTDH